MRWSALLVAVLIVLSSALGENAQAQTGTVESPDGTGESIRRDGAPYYGQERIGGKYIPPGMRSEPRRLVVLLHGYGSTVEEAVKALPLLEVAADRQWILLVPSGLTDTRGESYWNATWSCCDWNRRGNDDVAYLSDLIRETIARFPVAGDSAVVVGSSNGGFMAYQLACHASDVVAGVVVIAASEDERRSDCGATNPVSVFHIHGLFDRAVNFSGGTLGVIPEVYAPYPSAHDTVSRWVVRNACVESGFISGDPQAGEAGAWTECAFGTRVQYRWLPTGHRVEPTPALMTEIVEFIDLVHRSAAMVH